MRKQIFHINRMRNLPLTRLELVQFTGHKQVGKQIATLRALGIQFNVSQEGKLNVCRADIEQFQEQPRPDFYRLRTCFSELLDHLSSDKDRRKRVQKRTQGDQREGHQLGQEEKGRAQARS